MPSTYVLTLLAKDWKTERVQSFLSSLQSQDLTIDAGQVHLLNGTNTWMQRLWTVSLRPLSPQQLEHIREAAEAAQIDVFVESEQLFRTPRKLFVFDMDSTLIQAEIVDELAGLAGKKEEVSAITASAMRGEIDFPTSLTRRVSLLSGICEQQIHTLKSRIALGEGLEALMKGLKSAGCKTAILSGGFTFFARDLQQRLGFDYLCANELEIANGALTGRLATAIVDGPRKARALREFAEHEAISLDEAVAVGDGANDLPMIALAGTGVAYHAKPVVRAAATFRLNFCGLDALLHLLNRN